VVKQFVWNEKGSNETQSNIAACNIKRKPPKRKLGEPVNPVVHTAIYLNLSDDGQKSDTRAASSVSL
jgi:hypothetical protein